METWSSSVNRTSSTAQVNINSCAAFYSTVSSYLTGYNTFVVAYGNRGCKGGNMYDAYLYIIANDGIDTESSYTYGGQVRSRANVYIVSPRLHISF